MYYIKFVELEMRFCPLCKIMVLHECGSLFHQMDEESPMVTLFSVSECLCCGYLYDPNGQIMSTEYQRL
jgi:hypothetical protein